MTLDLRDPGAPIWKRETAEQHIFASDCSEIKSIKSKTTTNGQYLQESWHKHEEALQLWSTHRAPDGIGND